MSLDRDALFKATLERAWKGSSWWRGHLESAGIFPGDVKGLEDIASLPFTTKADLRSAYPLGWATVPEEELVRIHGSSGTTGKRTLSAYTAKDIADWREQFARCFAYAGVGPHSRVQVMVGYGLWTAGAGFQAGAEAAGALVVPTGPGNVDLQLELMVDLKTNVICSTSSFALLLSEQVAARGIKDQLALTTAIVGSERFGDAVRRTIQDGLGVEIYDIYGLTECYGPGIGIDCSFHDGIHVWSDFVHVEIVDPETLDPVPAGEPGEIVLTTLQKEGMPLIRYRTRDRSYLYPEPCPCGSPHPRIGRIAGRTDDMVKARGVAIFPVQIDSVIAEIEEVGSEYQLHVDRVPEHGDVILIKIESPLAGSPGEQGLRAELIAKLHSSLSVRPDVELVPLGFLGRSEGKSKRVFDHRPQGSEQ
jgi:phenylacetate-CoA ligase